VPVAEPTTSSETNENVRRPFIASTHSSCGTGSARSTKENQLPPLCDRPNAFQLMQLSYRNTRRHAEGEEESKDDNLQHSNYDADGTVLSIIEWLH